jgi:transcription elongation factor Elf1
MLLCGFNFSIFMFSNIVSCQLQKHPTLECAVAVSCGRSDSVAVLQCSKRIDYSLVADMRYFAYNDSKLGYVGCIEE